MPHNFSAYPPLVLAYIGDAVFELLVRKDVTTNPNQHIGQICNKTITYVNAISQSKMYDHILQYLDDDELNILKKARNAKSKNSSKLASVIQYKKATAIEALFGYLHLTQNTNRISELYSICKNIF